MAKNNKGKEIAVKKTESAEKKEVVGAPARMASPLRAWEREKEVRIPVQ